MYTVTCIHEYLSILLTWFIQLYTLLREYQLIYSASDHSGCRLQWSGRHHRSVSFLPPQFISLFISTLVLVCVYCLYCMSLSLHGLPFYLWWLWPLSPCASLFASLVKDGWGIVTPDECAKGALRDLGYMREKNFIYIYEMYIFYYD